MDRFKSVILIVILALGLILRLHNLNVWPREGATFDEYAWTFLGVSLLNTGVPTSWSPHPQYADKVHYVNPAGASFYLATPYLEHPPLFGLVAGVFAYLNGVHSFDSVTISTIRPLSVVLGLLSIVFVYVLATEVFGWQTGLLSAFLYAITPSVVNGSKLVQNENFFIPLFLFSIYLAILQTKDRHSANSARLSKKSGFSAVLGRTSVVLYCILFLLPLAKVPWIAAAGGVAAVYFFHKRWKPGVAALVSGLAGIGVYILWGFYWNRDLFLRLMNLQLGRYDIGYASIFALITDPIVTDRLFVDGIIYAGWAALFILLLKDIRKIFPIVAGFFSYLFLYLFAIPNEPGHGWYRYPLYPFLIISLAKVLSEVFNKNFVLTSLFLLLIGLPGMEHVLQPLIGFSFPVYRFFLILVGIGALPAVFGGKRLVALSKSVNRLLLVAVLSLTVFSALGYNEQ